MFDEAGTQRACGRCVVVTSEQETSSAMTSSTITGTLSPAIAAAVADPVVASTLATGIPVFFATGVPAKVVFANTAMLDLFGTTDIEALGRRLFASREPGAHRLAELSRTLSLVSTPRFERLRFYSQGRAEMLTMACRRIAAKGSGADHPNFLVVSLVRPRPRPRSDISLAPPTAPAPALGPSHRSAEPDSTSDTPVTGVPSETPNVLSAQDLGRDLADRFGAARTIRFLWQTGPDRRLTKITGQLCEAVGCVASDLIGRDFAELAEQLHLDPHGLLRDALARAETWSGIQIQWPIEGAAAALPIVLGALPAFDRQRRFEGFRGFGVIHVDPVARTLTTEPAREKPSAPVPPPDDERAPAAGAPSDQPFAPLGENVVALRPYQAQIRAASATAKDNSMTPLPRPDLTASNAEENPALSSTERLAFREIARTIAGHSAEKEDEKAISDVSKTSSAEPSAFMNADHESANQAPEPPALEEDLLAGAGIKPALTDLVALFDRLPIGLLVSRFGLPVFVNRTLLDWLGHRDTESFLVDGGLVQMFDGEPAARLNEASGDRAVLVKTRSGESIPVDARLQSIVWAGVPATLMTLRRSESVDQRSRTTALEQELRRSESERCQLRAILDTATDGVAVLDAEGRILSLNRSGEALFGYDQSEVTGEPFTFLLAKESQAAAADYLVGLRSDNVASLLNDGREVMGRARQGGVIPLFMALGRIDSNGEPKFCAVLRDVTQWKTAERELSNARREAERTSALKSDFLAKVSHEIRTPLNAILGFAEVMADERFGPIGNERYRDYLKDIHASGMHVMSLVNDLLDLSKIEAGKLELDFVHVDANRIVGECVTLMQPQANRERVILRLSLAARLPQIVADERSLRQIVLNLLSNAIKYNEPGGQVIVSTALTDSGHAVIRIRDTGIGMSESEVITALEPFRQIATSRNTSGTGLGLPLTKALVEANRAHFSIKSKKTEGTLVEVAFPPTRVLAAE